MFEYRVMIDQKLGLALVFGFLVLIEKPWFLRFEIYNRDQYITCISVLQQMKQ